MPQVNPNTYKPRTVAQVRLNLGIYKEIATKTGINIAQVMRYGDQFLKNSVADTVAYTERQINDYAPKATGQLRNSLIHQLHLSGVSNNILTMNLGTYVNYMKYVANMKEVNLRHPKDYGGTFIFRYRKGKRVRIPVAHNAKIAGATDGARRYVKYYGAPRWVTLDDPKAQRHFYQLIVANMRTKLERSIANEIKGTFPAGQVDPWTKAFRVI